MNNKKFGLTANTLKFIAIIAMLIDHIAWKFVPADTMLGFVMHMVGRLTAPIMCYFVAEGYYYTKDIKKYLGRMCVFAVVSHFAYIYYSFGLPPIVINQNGITILPYTSVIYTQMLGLLALIVWNHEEYHDTLKVLLIFIICMLSEYGDWGVIAVLWILFFGIYRGDFKKQMISFSIIGILAWAGPMVDAKTTLIYQVFNFGIYLSIPILSLYNGKSGKKAHMKWIFYMFYPLHLFILGILYFQVL